MLPNLCAGIKQNSYCLHQYWQIPEGNGSGVVWDDEGHIVTNYHGENQWWIYSFMLSLNSLSCISKTVYVYFYIGSIYSDLSECGSGSGLSTVFMSFNLTSRLGWILNAILRICWKCSDPNKYLLIFLPFPQAFGIFRPSVCQAYWLDSIGGVFIIHAHTHTHTNLSLSTRLLQIRWSYLIVTFLYYSVIGNALSRNPSSGQVVARVNILASDGWGSWRLSLHIMLLQKTINICISDTFNYKGYKRTLRLQSLGLTV